MHHFSRAFDGGHLEGINLAPGLAPRRLRDEHLNVELFFSLPDPAFTGIETELSWATEFFLRLR